MSALKLGDIEVSEVKQAEENVRRRAAEFEKAMDHFEEKLKGTTQHVQHIREVIRRPKQISKNIIYKTKTLATLYIERLRVNSIHFLKQANQSKIVVRIRKNPRPFILGVLTLLGTTCIYLIFRQLYEQRKRTKRLFLKEKDTNLIDQAFECNSRH